MLIAPLARGRLAIGVTNLFDNASTFFEGLENEGVPRATNAFAGGVPVPTERFGLPFRAIDVTRAARISRRATRVLRNQPRFP